MPYAMQGIALVALVASFFSDNIPNQAAINSACPAAQWQAEYFTNIDLDSKPAFVRCEDGPPNYQWNGASPAPGIPAAFSARWTGVAYFPDGPSTFTTVASDGVLVSVDGRIVINDRMWQPLTKEYGVVSLTAGAHIIVVEYFIEDPESHKSTVKLSWKAGAKKFANYCNERFGYCVSYPSNLIPDQLPMNGDGRSFHDPTGFVMTVYGSNGGGATVQAELPFEEGDFDVITYRALGKNWFVLSGHKGTNVVYIKAFVGPGSRNFLRFEYPASLKSRYDSIVEWVSCSFKPGGIRSGW